MPTEPEPKVSITTDFSALTAAFAEIGKSISVSFEGVKAAFEPWKDQVTQADYALQPGITQAQIAQAFDVPLEALGIDPAVWPHDHEQPVAKLVSTGEPGKYTLVNGPPEPEPEPELPVFTLKGWANPSSDPLADIQAAAVAKLKANPPKDSIIGAGGWIAPPLSNHSSGLALDINSPSNPYTGKPVPGEMYLEGSGDPFDAKVKPSFLSNYEPPKKTWETELGLVIQAGSHIRVVLKGAPVSTGLGWYQLGGEIVMTDLELAKKLIGVIPNDGPGTGIQVLEKIVGGEMFTWEAGTGWVPKDAGLDYLTFPEVSTTTHKLAFTAAPKWETSTVHGKVYDHPAGLPPQHPEDGTRHTGPDGAIWEFNLKGGWWVVESFGTSTGPGRSVYGWWCSYCGEHMAVHKGDPVACDSGGWCRPATSAEHKLAMMQA